MDPALRGPKGREGSRGLSNPAQPEPGACHESGSGASRRTRTPRPHGRRGPSASWERGRPARLDNQSGLRPRTFGPLRAGRPCPSGRADPRFATGVWFRLRRVGYSSGISWLTLVFQSQNRDFDVPIAQILDADRFEYLRMKGHSTLICGEGRRLGTAARNGRGRHSTLAGGYCQTAAAFHLCWRRSTPGDLRQRPKHGRVVGISRLFCRLGVRS